MSEDRLNQKTFEAFDEQDLSLVLTQVARRMIVLRPNVPDVGFWHSVLMKASKFLNASPELNVEETKELANTKGKAKVKVVRALRDRTGMRLQPCHKIVTEWIEKNIKRQD